MRIERAGWCFGMLMMLVTTASIVNGAPYDAAVLADNPLAYWRNNEAPSATVAIDAATSNGSQDGAYREGNITGTNTAGGPTLGVAGPSLVGDPTNTSVSLDGIRLSQSSVANSTDYISGSMPTLGANYSTEFWLNVARAHDGSLISGYVFARGANVFTADQLGVNGTADLGSSQQFNIFLLLNGSVFETSVVPVNGTWYDIAMVRSGNNVTLYVNGASVGSFTQAPGFSDGNILFGERADGEWPYQGGLDEIAIYDRALTSAEVASHYASATLVPEPSIAFVGIVAIAGVMVRRSKKAHA